jgi:hypothetical protein
VSDRTPVYPEHHLPQAPALQRLGAIVDAGFPPDVADLYVKTPSWPRHPDIREVRAGLARQRAEKRTAR